MRLTTKGFTLLEAVIALAIFAMGVTALYGWVNTNLITLARVDQVSIKSSSIQSAINLMVNIDPIEQPEGGLNIGHIYIKWVCNPTDYSADVLDEQNQITINKAVLYVAEVEIYQDEKLVHQFNMSILGIKKVRDISDVIFN